MKKFKSVFFVIVFLIIPNTQLSGKELSNVIGEVTYKIKKGDTLWSISKKFLGESSMWKEVWKVNSIIINPNLIYPGQTIRLKAVKKVDKKLTETTEEEFKNVLHSKIKQKEALFKPNPNNKDTYKIKKGDTLWSISKKFLGESSMWKEVWKVNSIIINPNLIYPGQTIRLKAVKKVDKKLVETTKKELSETLALNNKALKVLDHKEPELKSKLKTKDMAFNEASEKRSFGKVGEVDIFRVIEESKKVKNALKSSKDVSSLSEALFNGKQNPIGEIVKDVVKIIKEYGKKEGFIDISDKYEKWVVYTEERVDITDKVIELYNKNLEASN